MINLLENYKKNITILSLIMILIHSLGLIYMLFQSADFLAIFMKVLYIFLFVFYLIFLVKMPSKSHIMAIILSLIIFIYSCFTFDFLDCIIVILFLIYAMKIHNLILEQSKTPSKILHKNS